MVTTSSLAAIGALIGDPSRAAMLQALIDGRALTAHELAETAGVTPQTASGHLAQLSEAGLISVSKQGRHRYHRLATPQIAQMLEGLMQIAAGSRRVRVATGPRDASMRQARMCYDHIAGQLGVGISDSLIARGHVELGEESGALTASGQDFIAKLGIALPDGHSARGRLICRPCLDWSERRPHLAGKLGAALCQFCLSEGWIRRRSGTRALDVTPMGGQMFRKHFPEASPE